MTDINQHKITFSISMVVATLFVLPWVSLFEYAEVLRDQIPSDKINGRLIALWGTTFTSSILFFYFNFFRRRFIPLLRRDTWFINRSITVICNLVIVVLLSLILLWFMRFVFGIEARSGFLFAYVLRNLFVAFICVLVVYAYEKAQKSRKAQMNILSLKNEKTEAELKVLKGQLDPHFVFNNFNALAGAIREDPKEALLFVYHMSETFRYSIERRELHLISLAEELRFLESYIYLMQIRFKEGLVTEIDVDKSLLNKQLPHYALQLLFENAIKHNVVSVNKPLKVGVRSKGNNLIVSNNLQPKHITSRGTGIGLANLRKRYELLGHDSVHVLSIKNEFVVKLDLI